MEIVPTPRLPGPSAWTRLLVCLAVVAPVTLLALLPVGLGLERYVVDDRTMEPAIPQGSVLLGRAVPVAALRVGDVVTFRHPQALGEALRTERVVAVTGRGVHVRGDARGDVDPSVLSLRGPPQSRMVTTLPHLGHAYLLLGQPSVFGPLLGLSLAAALALGAARARRVGPRPTGLLRLRRLSTNHRKGRWRALCSLPWRNEFWSSRTRRTSRSRSSARWSVRDTTSTGWRPARPPSRR